MGPQTRKNVWVRVGDKNPRFYWKTNLGCLSRVLVLTFWATTVHLSAIIIKNFAHYLMYNLYLTALDDESVRRSSFKKQATSPNHILRDVQTCYRLVSCFPTCHYIVIVCWINRTHNVTVSSLYLNRTHDVTVSIWCAVDRA